MDHIGDGTLVRIGPFNYQILSWDEQDAADAQALGLCAPLRKIIKVADGQDYVTEAMTLIHEMLHAVWDTARLPRKHEERIVEGLATGLVQIWRDNPEVIDFITRRVAEPGADSRGNF